MKSVLHKLLIVCCALYLSGAHWLVLQGTAWTGMLLARVQQGSVAEAVATTFDGDHPCKLCSVVDAGKKQEQQQESQLPALKKLQESKLVEVAAVALPLRACSGKIVWMDFAMSPASRAEAPPTPPPRA